MSTIPTLSRGQKILASCGIFLFIGGLSWTYAQMRPTAVPPLSQAPGMQKPLPDEEPAPIELNIPPALTPETQPVSTLPVSTGSTLPDATNSGTTVTQTPPPQVIPTPTPEGGIFISSLASQGYSWRLDQAWDRAIFDNIFPLANLVHMDSYLVLDSKGQGIGRVTYVKAIDPSVQDAYAFLLMLARRDTSGKITITESVRNEHHIFVYNDLDKKENVRIVVQASAQEAFAIDLPAYLQGVVDVALSQF